VIHGWWALPSGLIAAAVGRRTGIPSVVTCDSGEFVALEDIGYGSQLRWRQRLAVGAATRLATRVIVCTSYQQELARSHHVNPSVIPTGVDTTRFTPGERRDGPPWRLLHAASLSPVKDQALLLGAFKLLIDRGIAAHLDIVGEDTLGGTIQALAGRSQVDRLVTFHGIKTSDELIPFYQAAHALVVSSRHEAAGVAALEAAACGVPVVGTSVGYLADWAPARAWTVPTGSPDLLANAIESLLRDRTRRDQITSAAREWVLAHDADWTADQLDRVYRDLRPS
jgi:glycosyltransferase involved in cell wall biosynthesis